jgi:hypothetical protein
VKFLYQDNSSDASDSIDNAFVGAVGERRNDVMELLQTDPRLTPNSVDEGFLNAVNNAREKLVQTLDDQHKISPSGLLRAFKRAVDNEYFSLAELVVNYLSADNVPRGYKLKAFRCAAERGETRALGILLESESRDWPVDWLQNALCVASSSSVKNLIRKTICDQLFSGRPQQVRASADCGHQIKTLEWSTD